MENEKVKEWENIEIVKGKEYIGMLPKDKWFSLIDALHNILLSNDEDIDLRLCSCRSVTSLLFYAPKKTNDTDITQRIQDNITTLQKILKDSKEPVILREWTGRELRGWYGTGIRRLKKGLNVEVPQPEQIKTDILQLLTNKEALDLDSRILIATSAYLKDESFIPVLEDLLAEVKDKDSQKKIKKIIREIKRGCEEEK
jgi:hypothetical protein